MYPKQVGPDSKVVVLGAATPAIVGALWTAGLRPVRAQTVGSVWAHPRAGRR